MSLFNVVVIEKLKPIAQWTKPIAIENVDYTFVSRRELEYVPGEKIEVTGAANVNKEVFAVQVCEDEVMDETLCIRNEIAVPTGDVHPDYPEYFAFKMYAVAKKRDIEALTIEIEAKEAEANNILKTDGKYIIANDYSTLYAVCKANNEIPTQKMINSIIRLGEIVERTSQNQAVKREMIRKATANEWFDINVGWQTDTLTPLGEPFYEV